MERRSFFGRLALLVGGIAGIGSARPVRAYADNVMFTNHRLGGLREYGLGFWCKPEILENRAEFHAACERMRMGMIQTLHERGPMDVWRAGECHGGVDDETGDFIVRLRQRAGRLGDIEQKALEMAEGAKYPLFTAK